MELLDILGRPMRDAEDPNRVASIPFKDFVYTRLADPKFVEGREGAAGAIFALETKTTLDKGAWTEGQYIALENEQYKALLRVIDKPSGGYDTRVQHCIVPYLRAIMGALDELPLPS